ncbi:MAG: relaxase domain-containing protein [Williamsia sp.]|nr:relaxase domain-containing protein [Williamsia sp.]
MIRMIQSRAAGHAKAYFSDALLKSDYYTSDQELAGYWQGRLAERLGVTGMATKETFFALCENHHPVTGKPLTPRTKEDRTTGYDINFHCPKSVSVLHALSGDDHILNAFQACVTETMRTIEADSKTRVRKGGAYDDRPTGELIWSHFVHQTARPVEGLSPDPHLHSHCFVFNATWDDDEKQIKAGQFRDIKRDMPYYQAYFHKALSDKLMTLGYAVRRTAKSFEVEGVPQRVIDLFSKRTDEIGRIAKEKGITDAKELGELGARTRSKKQKGTSMAELKQTWREQIQGLDPDEKGEGEKTIRFAPEKDTLQLTPAHCIDHALLHCFERASVMPDRRILEAAYRHGLGHRGVSVDAIARQFGKDDRLIHITEKSRTMCTTRDVLSEEKHMVELARQGQGKMIPLYQEVPELNLKGQQAAAITHVLTTPHRVAIIRGAAGTGKTTLMKEAIGKMEAAGKKVTVVAPTAQASRGVLKEEGFDKADTVAKLLTDKSMQQELKGQVLWVDEAGLLGTKDMTALLDIATKNNARLILGGDTRQHASVVRGDALRILNTVAGIRSAEVSKIYRQKNEDYRAAVEDLSKGDVPAAFEKLDALGSIQAVDPLQENKALVDDYLETIRKGKSGLVIAPTHAQGEEVTKDIRSRLRDEGLIGKKEIAAARLVNLNLTEAQKGDHRNFQAGHVIQFNQNAPGFKRGSVWSVNEANEKEVLIQNETGEAKVLPTRLSRRYDVYRQDEIHLSKGDRVRITRNGFDENEKRLNNGQALEVVSVSKKGTIVLRNELSHATYTIDESFGHLSHAHCITSHAAQGKTVDQVFISQPAATFPATDAKQFYVSVSRGKERARIYTDDKESLLHHAQELGQRTSALELVGKSRMHLDFVMQMQRENQYPKKTTEKNLTSKSKQREEYDPDI